MGEGAEEGAADGDQQKAEELAQVVDEPEDPEKKASDVLFNDPNDGANGQQQ